MRLKWIVLTLALALLPLQPAEANDKLRVMLDWFVNSDHAPLIVAESIGAFKAQGLDVEIIAPADPNLPPRLLAAKQVDIALSYQPQLYLLKAQGLPVIRVGTLITHPLNTVLALPGNGIKTIGDLKGKKIGYSVSGVEQAVLQAMLKSRGLDLSNTQLINVNFQLVSSLLSKQVDAVVGGFRNYEANELREKGVEPLVFNLEDYGVPAYDELVYLANTSDLADPRIKKFLAAIKAATAYLVAHPDESWAAAIKAHPELNTSLNRTAWNETLPAFAKDPAAFDPQRYSAYGEFLVAYQVIKKRLPVSAYAVDLTKP
jgi:putative hydroxymethylpyrimidine transport system substrate-binding protein